MHYCFFLYDHICGICAESFEVKDEYYVFLLMLKSFRYDCRTIMELEIARWEISNCLLFKWLLPFFIWCCCSTMILYVADWTYLLSLEQLLDGNMVLWSHNLFSHKGSVLMWFVKLKESFSSILFCRITIRHDMLLLRNRKHFEYINPAYFVRNKCQIWVVF